MDTTPAMTFAPDPHDAAVASRQSDLVRLQRQVDDMRAVLVRLLQDVVVAEKRLGASESSQLLEANEQLVVAAMRNQFDAETASQALDHAQRVAELDPLTQLPNRMLLLDRLNGAITIAKRYRTQLAVLFVDIDKFKEINDTLGHPVGDEALKFVAQCLVSSVRAADTVAGLGAQFGLERGDEGLEAVDHHRVGRSAQGAGQFVAHQRAEHDRPRAVALARLVDLPGQLARLVDGVDERHRDLGERDCLELGQQAVSQGLDRDAGAVGHEKRGSACNHQCGALE